MFGFLQRRKPAAPPTGRYMNGFTKEEATGLLQMEADVHWLFNHVRKLEQTMSDQTLSDQQKLDAVTTRLNKADAREKQYAETIATLKAEWEGFKANPAVASQSLDFSGMDNALAQFEADQSATQAALANAAPPDGQPTTLNSP